LRSYIKKNIIQPYYKTRNLQGVIFIGDIPSAQYTDSSLPEETRKYFYTDNMVSDFYYQDIEEKCKVIRKANEYCREEKGEGKKILLNCWIDDLYDLRSSNNECQILGGAALKPFWIARITPPQSLDQVQLLRSYFQKNHAYRTDKSRDYFRLLIYAPREENEQLRQEIYGREVNELKQSGVIVENSQVSLLGNSGAEYLEAIKEPYTFAFVQAHGTPSSIQPNIYPNMIEQSSPLVYTFTSCSVGDFRNSNYIAGYHLFSGDTLFVEACSVIHFEGSNIGSEYILVAGLPIFEAQESDYRKDMCYAWLGDPTIKISKRTQRTVFS